MPKKLMLVAGFTALALAAGLFISVSRLQPGPLPPLPTRMVLPSPTPTPALRSTPAPVVIFDSAAPDSAGPNADLESIVPRDPVPSQTIITFQPSAAEAERAAYIAQLGGTIIQSIPSLHSVVVSLPPDTAAQPLPPAAVVTTSEPDHYVVALDDRASDPLYPQQWHLPVIGAADGWVALTSKTSPVIVAVVDSGICAHHPDLAGRILPGYDFVDRDTMPQDDLGHGCGVAGIIAANTNNAEGIAGTAPNTHILPLRVLDAQGLGTYSSVAAAIVYAADHGATIINLSLGGVKPSGLLQDAIDYAIAKGALVIAAAGNTGGAVLYPAAYPPVVAVASVDASLQRSHFSSFGAEIDLLAPGENILTTSLDGGYQHMTGTSFAAPQAAGIAALELARGRTLNADGGLLRFSTAAAPVAPVSTAEPTAQPDLPSAPLMRNPAAVYCIDLGYRYGTVPGIGGGADGVCIFPNGERCEQWDFYAGTCGQTHSYCARQGLSTITLDDGADSFAPAYAACTDASGQIVGTVNELSSLSARAEGCYNGVCPQAAAPPAADSAINPLHDPIAALAVPAALDWRNHRGGNWLTAVRNQGSCGSCWAFAAVGVLESAIKIGALNADWSPEPDLSEQYLIASDCGANAGSCAGGYSDTALLFAQKRGLPDETCMPYQGQNTLTCSPTCANRTRADQIGVAYWPAPQYIKQNLAARGPVVVYMHIGSTSGGSFDSSGIFRCSHDAASDGSYRVDHAVVAVGYNDAGQYWIVRNSWGARWNGNGYFKVGYNECNIDNTFMGFAQQNLPAPMPLAADGSSVTVTFSWQGTPLLRAYDFRLTTAPDPNSAPVKTASTINTYFQHTFTARGRYYWHIRAASSAAEGAGSAWSTRPIEILGDPLDAAPGRNNRLSGSVKLSWSAVTWAASYEIQLDSSPGFTSPGSEPMPVSGLAADWTAPAAGTYFWRVRALDAQGKPGRWSAPDSFVVSQP